MTKSKKASSSAVSGLEVKAFRASDGILTVSIFSDGLDSKDRHGNYDMPKLRIIVDGNRMVSDEEGNLQQDMQAVLICSRCGDVLASNEVDPGSPCSKEDENDPSGICRGIYTL